MTQTICRRCVMDKSDKEITFDINGYCNHCKEYFKQEKKHVLKGTQGKITLQKTINKIKHEGKNNKYDCIIGISGGTDSSYLAYLAKQFNLRVLLVSLDCGWSTTEAKHNVQQIIEKTGYDVCLFHLNKKEFYDLQLSYLKASVPDAEVPSDHAINATVYNTAYKHKVKYILSGFNFVTEAILPKSWRYRKNDLTNLKDIHNNYGRVQLKTYPTMSLYKMLYYRVFAGIRSIHLLNYVEYNRTEATQILQKQWNWKNYGSKHHECKFCKFDLGYILPTKFNIDKRKAHLSTLICSGQITREQALKELEKPVFNKKEFKLAKQEFLTKLNLTEKEFNNIMNLPPKRHEDYRTDKQSRKLYIRIRDMKHMICD